MLKGRGNDNWAFAVKIYMILEGFVLFEETTLSDVDDRKARRKMMMAIDLFLYIHLKNKARVRGLWNKLKSLLTIEVSPEGSPYSET